MPYIVGFFEYVPELRLSCDLQLTEGLSSEFTKKVTDQEPNDNDLDPDKDVRRYYL